MLNKFLHLFHNISVFVIQKDIPLSCLSLSVAPHHPLPHHAMRHALCALPYGSVYAGPIGIILNPTMDLHRFAELPYSSSLNGSCTNVCPVKINIHEQIYKWRQVMVERHERTRGDRLIMLLTSLKKARPACTHCQRGLKDLTVKTLSFFFYRFGLSLFN